MPKTRTLLTLILVPVLAFAIACGGDDDDGGSSSGSGQPAATTPSGSSGSGSGGGSSGSGSGGSSGSSSQPDDSNDDEDLDAEAILANCPELISMFGGLGLGSPEGFGDDLGEAVAALQTAADRAPNEIKADMQLVASALGAFFSLLEEYNIDFSNPATFATLGEAEAAELEEAMSSFDTPELEAASERLDAYFTERCS